MATIESYIQELSSPDTDFEAQIDLYEKAARDIQALQNTLTDYSKRIDAWT
jgi:exonuclease VII small subunit